MRDLTTNILSKDIFQKHYDYYKKVGIETIKQQAGQVEQVSADYQGRVIFELLQNAFDKADKNILVKVVGNDLYVANDGTKFSFESNFDYKNGNSARSDFQSLCSISTSTKSIDTSIGNKGVGFKSAFSIAESEFVNVYTQGEIIDADKIFQESIGFRIYDSFKNANNISDDFDDDVKQNLKEKIKQVQLERKDRGVPGYYFPLQIPIEEKYIQELFNQGFVTVIQIPFKEEDKGIIKNLFTEIEKIHFQFIQLKQTKDFDVTFSFDGKADRKKVAKDAKGLFSVKIVNDRLKELAEKAGVKIEHLNVALYIKENPEGLMYNYLPTKVASPFKYIDFHADFHTKVDRTSINFDGNSSIGAYNKALLKACIELYFVVLNSYLEENERVELKLEYVDKDKVNFAFEEFDWKLIEINISLYLFSEITSILGMSNRQYETASNFFSRLTKKYFNTPKKSDEHTKFFSNISNFLHHYTSDSQQYSIWVERFKDKLSLKLLDNKSQIIPNSTLSRNSEIIYKKHSDSTIQLPEFIGVNITGFEINDIYFRKALGIKDFSDYNEVLKYYKQVSFTGRYSKEKITEKQQIELLKSLAEIFSNKREVIIVSTHRYSRMYTSYERDNNSPANQAYFNISTVFLKTKMGKYKPAQLCKKNDLDLHFLSCLEIENELDSFLKFLGVSLDSNYIFADIRIYNVLKNGLNYIPLPFNRNEFAEKLKGETILKNIRVIQAKGKNFHPALINDNNYKFLENISNNSINPELDILLVKKYSVFPIEYMSVLFEKVEALPNGIERLYSSLFFPFHEKLNKYLTRKRQKLEWLGLNDDFYIAQNRDDYEVLIKQDISVLCYFNGNEIPYQLLSKKISMSEGEIVFVEGKDVTENYAKKLQNKMVFILARISNSLQSDLNFREDSSKIKNIQEALHELKIFESPKLSRKIECNGIDLQFENEFDALFDKKLKTIYFNENCSTRLRTETLAKYIFNNISIVSELELILFFKDEDKLENDYSKDELNFFKQLWVKDYDKKYSKFEKEVLEGFYTPEEKNGGKWHIYNSSHKSELILRLYNETKLYDLEDRIENVKPRYNGLFDEFSLVVDFTLNDEKISKMITFLNVNSDEVKEKLIKELEVLSKMLGKEDRLQEIEQEIKVKYQYDINKNQDSSKVDETGKALNFERKVSSIFDKISQSQTRSIGNFTAEGLAGETNININKKKLIFQGETSSSSDEKYLEGIGSNGEEQVLGYYINQFLLLPIVKREKAILEIYEVIKLKLNNDTHEKFKDECIKVINEDDKLRRSLIPYFYIAMHHKYSYFDLIVYKNNNPSIVEVKSTQSSENDSFYISISEVNEARKEANYEIVRVTPSEIVFMGNPIKKLSDKITSISGDNYKLIPRNYKFEFSKKNEDAK